MIFWKHFPQERLVSELADIEVNGLASYLCRLTRRQVIAVQISVDYTLLLAHAPAYIRAEDVWNQASLEWVCMAQGMPEL
ncbi:hypothetical protein I7I50_06116 [Histoplasma capsulatum G186AR]|uniref:Uncharacterized protein n=1 Tax=Ajellomyces capsulatus TaxID=5037 RepID=A0A8H7YZX2_AJECA|nr:hypothetical protein I7I52_10805 [Histoplasma capsulatum]QSS67122.1 hypothetical protein I7I50_06116 [Histoplasma capsulatum G186AR]